MTCCRKDDECRVVIVGRDVEGPSLAALEARFFLRKLGGSSLERVGDGEDWASESFDAFDGCDDPLADANVGDVGDCADVLSTPSNFVRLVSRSRSLSFSLAEVELTWAVGVAMSPTPTVFSHKFPMRPFPVAAGGQLYTRNAVPSRMQSVRRHFRSRACTPGAENSILRGMIARR
jgi:hypothetical protein